MLNNFCAADLIALAELNSWMLSDDVDPIRIAAFYCNCQRFRHHHFSQNAKVHKRKQSFCMTLDRLLDRDPNCAIRNRFEQHID
jgi:hypothetical protein